MEESILDYIPLDNNEKTPYRLQTSTTLEEASQLDKYVKDPTLPFKGDNTKLIRTLLRAGLVRLHLEHEATEDSFISSMKPMLGSELLRWSTGVCDSFALAAVDHTALATDSGDPVMGEDVVQRVVTVLQEVNSPSAQAMLRKALIKRGFIHAVAKLRETLLEHDHNVYYLDNVIAENFS